MEKELIFHEQMSLFLYDTEESYYKPVKYGKIDNAKESNYLSQEMISIIDPLNELEDYEKSELKELKNYIEEFLYYKETYSDDKVEYYRNILGDPGFKSVYIGKYLLNADIKFIISDRFAYTVDQFILDDNYYNSITDLSNAIFYNSDYFDLTYYDEFDCCKDHDTLYHEIDCLTDKFKNRIQFTCKEFRGCYSLKEIEINHVSAATDTVFFNFKSCLSENDTNNIIEAYLYDNH